MRVVIGISGASGSIYGVRLLELLKGEPDVETHLIMSPAAKQTLLHETSRSVNDVVGLADYAHGFRDIAAAPSSGSFLTSGMIICPCSMRTLSGVALSSADNLLVRAADVTLKERRRLVLVTRETPLHLGHLRLMVQATESGAVIAPPMPAFYSMPESIDDLVDHTAFRLLDLFGITIAGESIRRWPRTDAVVADGELNGSCDQSPAARP